MHIDYPAQRRGHSRTDWLDSYHTFSFAEFFDPERMGVSVLRVVNDDLVEPGGGFARHPHRDMEIITYVVAGTIAHEDSLGHRFQVPAGDVQRMTAGRGIAHSEYNASQSEPLRLLQIWVLPEREGLEPGYEQRALSQAPGLTWFASGDHTPGTLHIHQDVRIGRLQGVTQTELPLAAGRIGFLQVVDGGVTLGDRNLNRGDAIAIHDEGDAAVTCAPGTVALWFDLPGFRH